MAIGRTHRPHYDRSRCKICELCRWMCPDLAITKAQDEDCIRIDLKYCKGCGICAEFCPKGAIWMVLEAESQDSP